MFAAQGTERAERMKVQGFERDRFRRSLQPVQAPSRVGRWKGLIPATDQCQRAQHLRKTSLGHAETCKPPSAVSDILVQLSQDARK